MKRVHEMAKRGCTPADVIWKRPIDSRTELRAVLLEMLHEIPLEVVREISFEVFREVSFGISLEVSM